jgi:hypothetical protein
MSDEPRKLWSRAWIGWALVGLIAIASYETVHYSTVCRWNGDVMLLGWSSVRTVHVIDDKPLPQWVESFFWPAYQVDRVIGYSYGAARPYMCILQRPPR